MINAPIFPTLSYGNVDEVNKEVIYKSYINTFLNRLLTMFKWSGLPPEIDTKYLELYLLTNGTVSLFKINDMFYCTFGGYGGEPNAYYLPKYYIVANPYIPLKDNMLLIDGDCVVGLNNSLSTSIMDLVKKYSMLLTENELTMKVATINSRMQTVISASDNQTIESAKIYLNKLKEGDFSVIAENEFLNGVRVQPSTNSNRLLVDVIELEQYLKASFYHEIGLNANYNMKRESLNSSETSLNEQSIKPLVFDMLERRKEFANKINELYGLDVTVEFSDVWNELEEVTEESTTELLDSNQTENNNLEEPQLQSVEDVIEYIETWYQEKHKNDNTENEENEEEETKDEEEEETEDEQEEEEENESN